MKASSQQLDCLRSKRFWLFDMDGTITQAMHDFDAIRKALELPYGVPILEALSTLPADQASAKTSELNKIELDMASQAVSQPGSHELLEQLAKSGVQLGIVTRNGLHIAKATLIACGLHAFFDTDNIISRDCCRPKPDPEGLLVLLSKWGAAPSEAVMVGDYLFDLDAGRRAGVTTIHFDVTNAFSWPHLTDIGISSFTELNGYLPVAQA